MLQSHKPKEETKCVQNFASLKEWTLGDSLREIEELHRLGPGAETGMVPTNLKETAHAGAQVEEWTEYRTGAGHRRETAIQMLQTTKAEAGVEATGGAFSRKAQIPHLGKARLPHLGKGELTCIPRTCIDRRSAEPNQIGGLPSPAW